MIKNISRLPERKQLQFKLEDYGINTIELDRKTEGELKIEVSFEVNLLYDTKGCFISVFDDLQVISTHFEPNFARKAFPCFDEPCYKSIFQLKIQIDDN